MQNLFLAIYKVVHQSIEMWRDLERQLTHWYVDI